MSEVLTKRQSKTIVSENLLKYHGLIRYHVADQVYYGCVFCYKNFLTNNKGCKCTKRNPTQELKFVEDSSCAVCSRALVKGEKTCEPMQVKRFVSICDLDDSKSGPTEKGVLTINNPNYNSDCKKLEMSGDQGTLTRERIVAAIQLRSDTEGCLLDEPEINLLKKKHTKSATDRTTCGSGIQGDCVLSHHGVARIEAGFSSESLYFRYFCCFCFRKTQKNGCECVSRPLLKDMSLDTFSSCSICRLGIIDGVKQCWYKPGFDKCRKMENHVYGSIVTGKLLEYSRFDHSCHVMKPVF